MRKNQLKDSNKKILKTASRSPHQPYGLRSPKFNRNVRGPKIAS